MLVLATVLVVAGLLVSAFVPWWRDRGRGTPPSTQAADSSSATWVAGDVGNSAWGQAGHADAGCSDGGGSAGGDGGACH